MARQASYDEPIQIRGNPSRGELLARLDEAVRAVRARPNSTMRHCNRAVLLLMLGRPEEAMGAADEAVEAELGSADAHNINGIALRSLDRKADALRSFERAIELDPANMDARNNRGGILMELGRHADAVEELDKVIKTNPRRASAHVNRGKALHFLGHNAEAVRSLRRAVSLRHDDATTWFNIGALLFQMKSAVKSLGAIETAIKVQPRFAKAHHARGIVLRHLGRQDEAKSAFERAYALDPSLVAPGPTVKVDDIYVAWHEARDIYKSLVTPTSPKDLARHHIRSRVAEFLNASRRVLEYHKKQHGSDIVDDYHRLETKAKRYLQYVNKAKHEYLPNVRITKTGEHVRAYPDVYTGESAIIIGENAQLRRNGKCYDIDTCYDGMFGEDFGRGFCTRYRCVTCN